MKDDYIRFKVDSKLKNDFQNACDGRTMTYVLIEFMKKYIEDSKKNKENNKGR